MKLFLSLGLTVLSLLGIIDAGYITYTKLFHVIPSCRPPFSCQTVLDSKWSSVGPVPLSAFGVIFYTTMMILSIFSYLNSKTVVAVREHKLTTSTVLVIFGIFGLLFSSWLVFIMGFLLNAWCLFCLLSAINCLVIFFVTISIYLSDQEKICV